MIPIVKIQHFQNINPNITSSQNMLQSLQCLGKGSKTPVTEFDRLGYPALPDHSSPPSRRKFFTSLLEAP